LINETSIRRHSSRDKHDGKAQPNGCARGAQAPGTKGQQGGHIEVPLDMQGGKAMREMPRASTKEVLAEDS
jgi:hypothetical protein